MYHTYTIMLDKSPCGVPVVTQSIVERVFGIVIVMGERREDIFPLPPPSHPHSTENRSNRCTQSLPRYTLVEAKTPTNNRKFTLANGNAELSHPRLPHKTTIIYHIDTDRKAHSGQYRRYK